MRRIVAVGVLVAVGLGVHTSTAVPARATELGGNYNQYVCDISNGLVVKSGVRWVRSFVSVPRNLFAYGDPADPNRVSGILDVVQASDAVSGASERLGTQTATKLRQLKRLGSRSRAVRVILNLKLDMKYVPDPSAPIPVAPVPVPGSPEYMYWRDAVARLLTGDGGHGLNVGPAVDVLVLGNEPMFEVPDNPTSAVAYRAFLQALIADVVEMRDGAGLRFQIFLGALDKPSKSPTSPILGVVVDEVNENPAVDGLDLHLHEDQLADVAADLEFVRDARHVSKRVIVTEFSLVGLWNAHANQPLGDWGREHGYDAGTTVAAWLDSLMTRASDGDPVPSAELAGFFEEQPWYPEHWFDTFMTEFEAHDVMAATYGLSAAPNVDDLPFQCSPSARIPLTGGRMVDGAYLWVLDFVYNGALLGMADDGYYVRNPLVADDYARWLAGHGAVRAVRDPHFAG